MELPRGSTPSRFEITSPALIDTSPSMRIGQSLISTVLVRSSGPSSTSTPLEGQDTWNRPPVANCASSVSASPARRVVLWISPFSAERRLGPSM